MRSWLVKLNNIYDLCEVLGISESDYDDFIEGSKDKGFNCNDLDKIIRVLEMSIKIKEELKDHYNSSKLNNMYENFIYRWDANDIGVKIYVDNVNDVDVEIIVEDDSIEVCDRDNVDETDEMYEFDEYKRACEYAINMKDVEAEYDEEDEEEDEED